MNPNALVFHPKFNLDEKFLQIFDTTPYVANLITPSNVKGYLITAKRDGSTFYTTGGIENPDVTFSPNTNRNIPMPLTADGEVAEGEYEFNYSSIVKNEVISVDSSGTISPAAATFNTMTYEGAPITDFVNKINNIINETTLNIFFLNAGGTILGSSIVLSCAEVDSDLILTFNPTTIASFATIVKMRFQTQYEKTIEVAYGCEEWPSIAFSVKGDCIRAQVCAEDSTNYLINDVVDRLITINYPLLPNGSPVLPSTDTTESIIIVGPPVWTGGYTISLVTNITRFSGVLEISKTFTVMNYFVLTCAGDICFVISCLNSLFNNYQLAVRNQSQFLPTLRDNFITSMGYWMLYTQYIDCGKVDEATQCLNELKNYLNAIGCECNCTDCDDNTSNAPKEIYPLFSDPQPNYIPISYLEIDDIVTDSNTKVPSNKAVITYVAELLTNYYTEAEINALLANYYTKTEITFLLNNYYSKAEINAFLLNYYTKVQSDARYIPIYADNPQSGIDNNNLSGYISLNANNAPIIPGQIGLFSFINNKVASTDLVIIQIKDQSLIPGSYYTLIDVTARNGSVDFSCILNGASSVDDPITFQFIVCKGQ